MFEKIKVDNKCLSQYCRILRITERRSGCIYNTLPTRFWMKSDSISLVKLKDFTYRFPEKSEFADLEETEINVVSSWRDFLVSWREFLISMGREDCIAKYSNENQYGEKK